MQRTKTARSGSATMSHSRCGTNHAAMPGPTCVTRWQGLWGTSLRWGFVSKCARWSNWGVALLLAALALPSVTVAQTPFACQSDGVSQVCTYPPAIQYGVFSSVRVFGASRDEACLKYAAATPRPERRQYVGVQPGQYSSSGLFYCVFQWVLPNGQMFESIDGDNREIKVCPVNAVMFNAGGQYDNNNWFKPGALFMSPLIGNPMPDSSTVYPASVMVVALTVTPWDYGRVMCASRDATIPTRTFGGACPHPQVGNPIHIGVGIKSQSETDYARHGRLHFVRTYNSGAGTTYFDAALGRGWQHNFGARISAANVVTAWRSDGRIVEFALHNGAWGSWADVTDRLVEIKDAGGSRTGWQYVAAASGDTERYDVNGNLVTLTTRSGATLTLTYTDGSAGGSNGSVIDGTTTALPRGLLRRVTDQFGASLAFGYNVHSHIVRLTRPDGLDHRYTYDTDRNLVAVTSPEVDGYGQPLLRRRTYVYDNPSFTHALTGIVDENGQRHSTYSYDTFGRAVTTERALGSHRYSLTFNTDGSTSVTDPLGTQRNFGFNNLFGVVRVASQSQPSGAGCGPASATITYDDNANVASRTDFNGIKTCYAYDLSRNLETRRGEGLTAGADCAAALAAPPAGSTRVVSTTWHHDWRLETVRAEPLKRTTWVYNGHGATCAPPDALVDGLPIAVVCQRREQATSDATGAAGFGAPVVGAPRVWTSTYNRWGQVLTAKGPRTDVDDTTVYAYYPDTTADWTMGDLASVTNAAGQVTRLPKYNPHGQVLESVDPNGLVTTYTYDLRQRLTARQVGTERTTFIYDPVGKLTAVTLSDGSAVTYTYDAAHRLTQAQDNAGNTIAYTLDAMGNRIGEEVHDPGGQLTQHLTRVYDALNRLQQLTGGTTH
jgi:YD repeat-containing protein